MKCVFAVDLKFQLFLVCVNIDFSFSYLFDCLQHALAALPRLGVLPDAAQAGHTVPLPVLQLPVEGVGQQQHCVINVAVGDLER